MYDNLSFPFFFSVSWKKNHHKSFYPLPTNLVFPFLFFFFFVPFSFLGFISGILLDVLHVCIQAMKFHATCILSVQGGCTLSLCSHDDSLTSENTSHYSLCGIRLRDKAIGCNVVISC